MQEPAHMFIMFHCFSPPVVKMATKKKTAKKKVVKKKVAKKHAHKGCSCC